LSPQLISELSRKHSEKETIVFHKYTEEVAKSAAVKRSLKRPTSDVHFLTQNFFRYVYAPHVAHCIDAFGVSVFQSVMSKEEHFDSKIEQRSKKAAMKNTATLGYSEDLH